MATTDLRDGLGEELASLGVVGEAERATANPAGHFRAEIQISPLWEIVAQSIVFCDHHAPRTEIRRRGGRGVLPFPLAL